VFIPRKILLLAVIACLQAACALAATRYVDLHSPGPIPPFTDWSTAATNIQDAINASASGDVVLVTNGVYDTGGVANSGSNRIYVSSYVMVKSVNGPGATVIRGYQVPGTTNGNSAVRGAYIADGGILSGFTVTNGATLNFNLGGGIYCDSTNALITNCVITRNASTLGGGAFSGTLVNSFVTNNRAIQGGWGGGANSSLLINCLITDNAADYIGGGAYSSLLINCTVVGNTALGSIHSGGVAYSTVENSIVYYNNPDNGSGSSYPSSFANCCTIPMPSGGSNNVSAPPGFANQSSGNLRLMCPSPCVDSGDNSIISIALDLDGNPRIAAGLVDIGAYEYPQTALLGLTIAAGATNLVPGFLTNFTAIITTGCPDTFSWDFGDGTKITNQLSVAHRWTTIGDYLVVLQGYNTPNSGGVSATNIVHVANGYTYYVDCNSSNPTAPFSSWSTAANTIQDAIDAALPVPTSRVLVTNGIYNTGVRIVYGTTMNRVAITKPIIVQSVNGPAETLIVGVQVQGALFGDDAVRCVFLTNGASLIGFTITNGATRMQGDTVQEQCGGGVLSLSTSTMISNCVVIGNAAYGGGGGAVYGTLRDCSVLGNSSPAGGGGVNSGILYGCTLSSNNSRSGGGIYASKAFGCRLVGNTASTFQYNPTGGAAYGSGLDSCVIAQNAAFSTGSLDLSTGGGLSSCAATNCTIATNSANGGGGASSTTMERCTIIGNSAVSSGAAHECILHDCVVAQNSSYYYGAVAYSTLDNCTLVGNQGSDYGGCAAYSTLNNCISYYNSAPSNPNWFVSTVNASCTYPTPTNGIGSITNEPLLANLTNNWHLRFDSPCINRGSNTYVSLSLDLDGHGRIRGSAVDIGAYEFQDLQSIPFYKWLQQFGLATDGSADFADSDGDGLSNWQEWRAGTIPTNVSSVLRLFPPYNATPPTITWQSATGIDYFVDRCSDLRIPFSTIQTNIPGQPGTTTYTDTNATGSGPFFYRVGVQTP
jgi:hypothetical protein